MAMSKETRTEVKMYQSNGWDIKEETPEFVKLTRNTETFGGHILVAVFLGWWTLFIANIIYHFMSKETKKIIK